MTAVNTVAVTDIDPFSDEYLTDPYESHRRLRDMGPVVFFEKYGAWGVARHEHVLTVLQDPETFCSSAGVGLYDLRQEKLFRPKSLLIEADPPEHTRARAVMTKVLTVKVIRSLKENYLEHARNLMGELVARGRFDGVPDLGEAFVLAVIPDLFGLPKEGREHLLPYAATSLNSFGPRNKHYENALANAKDARPWMERQFQPGTIKGGFAGQIHDEASAQGFSSEDSSRLVMSLLTAGLDTTITAIGNAALCLVQNPEQFELLRQDPSLARSAFEEAIRFESPKQQMFRTTTRPVELAGHLIPADSKVLLVLGSANRDPRHWGDDADSYRISRRATTHVGFGNGIHTCVGQMLARLEGECVLTAMAEQIADMRVDGPIVRKLNNTLRGMRSLPIAVTKA